jgi:hypothetical protein
VTVRHRLAAALVAALAVAGCGGGHDGVAAPPTSAALTSEQASRLAPLLFDNLESQGATFSVAARTAEGDTITLTGVVDWGGHVGRADVVATGAESDLVEIVWTEDVILERRPELLARLLDDDGLAVDYLARAPAPATRTVDRLVAVLAALAGDTRDNPLLVAQSPGSASFGTAGVLGREAEALRYGAENRYWLDVETGELLRFEQPPSADRDAFVVDLIARGPQAVDLPPVDRTIAATDVRDRYPFELP